MYARLMAVLLLILSLRTTLAISFLNITEMFGARSCAFIFRVDDVGAVRTIKYITRTGSEWYDPYLFTNLSYIYRVKTVIGIITDIYYKAYNNSLPVYHNITYLQMLSPFLKKINDFDEVASHSRWHLLPHLRREYGLIYSDIIGSYEDLIEAGIRPIFTMIWPFGAHTEQEDRIALTKYKILMGTAGGIARLNDFISGKNLPVTYGFGNRFDDPTNIIHKIIHTIQDCIENDDNEVIIVATHPHSFDWTSWSIAFKYTKELFKALKGNFSEYLWFTTPGEIYSYLILKKGISVIKITNNVYRVCETEQDAELYAVPVTLEFALQPFERVQGVLKDGKELPEANPSDTGSHSSPLQTWFIRENKLYVNVYVPPGRCLQIAILTGPSVPAPFIMTLFLPLMKVIVRRIRSLYQLTKNP